MAWKNAMYCVSWTFSKDNGSVYRFETSDNEEAFAEYKARIVNPNCLQVSMFRQEEYVDECNIKAFVTLSDLPDRLK